MSLEYYLLCRNKYDNIILHLKEIIENYDDIFLHTANLDLDEAENIMDFYQHNTHKDQFVSKLKCVTSLRQICESKIKQICNHEFVTDMIDINPERSQNITFCRICDYTIPN